MKNVKTNNFTTKKFFALALGFVLLIATVFGILFGTKTVLAYPGDISVGHTRMSEYTITDDSILLNSYDLVDFSSPSPGTLIDDGYRYATVEIDFMMREINDGYQEVYLFKNLSKPADDYFDMIKLNCSGNTTNSTYGAVHLRFKSLVLADLLGPNTFELVIRYGASGVGRDTWQNKNCAINVILSRDSLRSKNEVKWG